ncbi:MAG: YciI family protein [Pseudomonadota bacterium]
MQKFMFIYHGGDPEWHASANEEELMAGMKEWETWMEALSAKGQLVSGGDPLEYSGKRLNAKGVVTDIASAELKELVSGYSVVSAESIDEAVEIARTCPIWQYPHTTVEVRPIQEYS